MKEIGGYFELEKYRLPMMHEGALALNCGRNCLAYLIRLKQIKKIALPYFLCDSVKDIPELDGKARYYHIDWEFLPINIELMEDEWIYLVNYYGQLTEDKIQEFQKKNRRIILDQAQAYFAPHIDGVNTIYTCRKFFGVPDGAFLYTDEELTEDIPFDESYMRMQYVMGRFERKASDFYNEYCINEEKFKEVPIRRMSKLTDNLLHGIDYSWVKRKRTENYSYLYEKLSDINRLNLRKVEGAYAYPLLMDEGDKIRKRLIENKIYIPVLWPNVLEDVKENTIEYQLAKYILPIPCDQRYGTDDMERIYQILKEV